MRFIGSREGRRRNTAVAGLAPLLLLPGCFFAGEDPYEVPSSPPTPLAELPGARIDVRVVPTDTPQGRVSELRVGIFYAGAQGPGTIRHDNAADCPTLHDSFALTLDGAPLELNSRGGWRPNGLDDRFDCGVPWMWMPIPPALQRADSTLILSDASRTYTVALGDLLLPRAAEVIGGAGWTLYAGELVQIQWTPASDVPAKMTAELRFGEGQDPRPVATLEPSVGDALHFRLVTPPPVVGASTFALSLARAPQSCGEGCTVNASYQLSRSGTLRPARSATAAMASAAAAPRTASAPSSWPPASPPADRW